MTARAKQAAPSTLAIPLAIVGAGISLILAIIAGVISINRELTAIQAQNVATKERVDFLYQIEMQRYPRAGPPASEGRGQ